MNLLDDIVLNHESIYDILNATVDEELLKEVAESHMEFTDTTSIILYTSLNKTNTQLLKQGKYTKPIKAFEYYESALGIKQSEYIIKISYNTQDLYDTLHPKAYQEVEQLIKKANLKKSDIEDMEIIRHFLTEHTGIRIHSIDPTKKCYTKTHILFNNSKVSYILKPDAIKIISIAPKPKETQQV